MSGIQRVVDIDGDWLSSRNGIAGYGREVARRSSRRWKARSIRHVAPSEHEENAGGRVVTRC